MNPERLMTQRCSLTGRQLDEDSDTDEYGNPQPETFTVEGVPCLLQQAQNITLQSEGGAVGEIQSETYRVLLPARIVRTVDDVEVEVEPDGIDAMTVEDIGYEFSRPPWRVFNPRLRRVTHVEGIVGRSA